MMLKMLIVAAVEDWGTNRAKMTAAMQTMLTTRGVGVINVEELDDEEEINHSQRLGLDH